MAEETGFLFLVIVGIPVLFYYGVFLWKLSAGSYHAEFTGLLIGSTLWIQLSRKDKEFQQKLGLPAWRLRASEYLLLWLPFLVAMMIGGGWLEALLVTGFSLLFSLLPWTIRNPKALSFSFRWLPAGDFEWRTGMKAVWYLWLGLSLGALVFARETAVIPLTLIVLALIAGNFNRYAEPMQMLQVFPDAPEKFLWTKVKRQFTLYGIAIAPLVLVWMVLFYRIWFVMAAALVIASVCLLFSICLKYSHYRPHTDLRIHWHWMWITPLWFTMPFLIPVPFLLLMRNWRKAIDNLSSYLA